MEKGHVGLYNGILYRTHAFSIFTIFSYFYVLIQPDHDDIQSVKIKINEIIYNGNGISILST